MIESYESNSSIFTIGQRDKPAEIGEGGGSIEQLSEICQLKQETLFKAHVTYLQINRVQ